MPRSLSRLADPLPGGGIDRRNREDLPSHDDHIVVVPRRAVDLSNRSDLPAEESAPGRLYRRAKLRLLPGERAIEIALGDGPR